MKNLDGRTTADIEPVLAQLQADIEAVGTAREKARRRLIMRGIRSAVEAMATVRTAERFEDWFQAELFQGMKYGTGTHDPR
ncbi:hypothetical protein D9M70_314120 [compost metagenome]